MRKVVPSQAHGRKRRQADQNLSQAVQESSVDKDYDYASHSHLKAWCRIWALSLNCMKLSHGTIDITKVKSQYNVNTKSLQSNARKACHWNQETWAASGNTSPSLITRTDLGNKEAYDQTENIWTRNYLWNWINRTLQPTAQRLQNYLVLIESLLSIPFYVEAFLGFRRFNLLHVDYSLLEHLLWWVWQYLWETRRLNGFF